VAAVALIVGWAVSGPFFGFSESWQLVINTGTTIVTFLMVFVIQASQNRDNKALHLKLDEIIRAVSGARNELIGAEQSTEEQIRQHEEEFLKIAERGGVAAVMERPPAHEPREAARAADRSKAVRRAARSAAVHEVQEESGARGSGRGNGTAKATRQR
jgi:low affinity Fe/Cu permease